MGILSIKNLDLYYDDFKALKNINMEIEKNKITAFIGHYWWWQVYPIEVNKPHERLS